MNTTQIGDVSEHKFVLRCLERGIPILRPVGNNLPYDFVIELNGLFCRVQVKTGYKGRSTGTIQFNTRSTSKNYTEVVSKGYYGKVDFFAVVSQFVEYIMILPISEVSKGAMVLSHVDSRKKNQKYCADYIF